MTRRLSFPLAVLAVLAAPVTWSAEPQPCGSPLLHDQTLTQIRCEERGTGRIEHYQDAAPPSPYATEFDRRNVAVARSADPSFFVETAGLRGRGSAQTLTQTLLVTPPAVDQLRQRRVAQMVKRYRGWVVNIEHLAYKAEGDKPGFVFNCATAMRSGVQNTTALAECFGVEEMPRFLRTLEATD